MVDTFARERFGDRTLEIRGEDDKVDRGGPCSRIVQISSGA